jgi:hypothetical protein
MYNPSTNVMGPVTPAAATLPLFDTSPSATLAAGLPASISIGAPPTLSLVAIAGAIGALVFYLNTDPTPTRKRR